MAASFTREQVAAIAALAYLELDEAELDLYARQLADILAAAEDVQRVDTTGVPPTAGLVAADADERADRVHASLEPEAALANAPDPALDAGLFRVPRVIG